MSEKLKFLKEKLEKIPFEEWPNYIQKAGYEVPYKYLEKLKDIPVSEIPLPKLKKFLKKAGYKFPSKKLEKLKKKYGEQFPHHVGLIIDGNRRWAEKKGLDANAGHFEGYETLRKILFTHGDIGINYLSIYTLSIENIRRRDPEEIEYLYSLIVKVADDLLSEKNENKERVKFNVFGRLSILPTEVKEKLEELMEETKNNNEFFINLCIAYDGQEEIVDAIKALLSNSKIDPQEVSPQLIKKYLYTKDYPELDYIVRTGMKDGARISGFMLWDASYSEFKFRKEYWPDYNEKMLTNDLKEYLKRIRRKGK